MLTVLVGLCLKRNNFWKDLRKGVFLSLFLFVTCVGDARQTGLSLFFCVYILHLQYMDMYLFDLRKEGYETPHFCYVHVKMMTECDGNPESAGGGWRSGMSGWQSALSLCGHVTRDCHKTSITEGIKASELCRPTTPPPTPQKGSYQNQQALPGMVSYRDNVHSEGVESFSPF